MELIPKSLREQLLTADVRHSLWYVMGLSLAVNILLLTSPLYMLQMYDRVLTSRSDETLYAISAIALFLLVGFGALEVMRSRTLVGVGITIDNQMRNHVFTRLLRGAVLHGQGISAQPVRDLEMIRNLVSGNTLLVLFDLPWAPLFLLLIYSMSPLLGLMALAGAVVSVVLAIASNHSSRALVEETAKQQIAAARFVDVCLRNVDTIHANGFLEATRTRWLTLYEKSMLSGAASSEKVAKFGGVTKTFRIIMQSVMLGFGAWLALKNELSPGAMIAASIIFGRAIAPLDQSIGASKGLLAGLAAMKRLAALLPKAGVVEQKPMSLPKPKGALKVEGLTLIPAGQRKPILHGVSFELNAGETLAVIGPSASGKSSLARAIVGLWPPASGKVRIDGADIEQWETDTRGRFMGYLPQDIELLTGTVKDNINRFSNAAADAVIMAANQAGCHELILNLPEGYDTYLGEGGHSLSGGQSQRIALARAYFGAPALVVLDEPDSSLDTEGGAALDAALVRMKQRGTTAILITHNARILRYADKALLLRNGNVAYYGPPQDLLKKPQEGKTE